jgi:hypothetical protein
MISGLSAACRMVLMTEEETVTETSECYFVLARLIVEKPFFEFSHHTSFIL